MSKSAHDENYWSSLIEELKERVRVPIKHPTFVGYFVVVVVVFGGWGFLETLINYCIPPKSPESPLRALVGSAYTYYFAIAATAALDLILASKEHKYLLMFSVGCSVLVGILAWLSTLCCTSGSPWTSFITMILGLVLSLFLWWISNSKNSNLLDTPSNPEATTGGKLSTPIAGEIPGDFKIK